MILEPCPYCGSPTKVVLERTVYGRSFSPSGKLIACSRWPACDAYTGYTPTGCHYGHPVRVADKAHRELKRAAHDLFDHLWRSGAVTRDEAYDWLADLLGIEKSRAHMKLLDPEQLRRVIAALTAMKTSTC